MSVKAHFFPLFYADHGQLIGLIPSDGEDKIIMDNVSNSGEWFPELQTLIMNSNFDDFWWIVSPPAVISPFVIS